MYPSTEIPSSARSGSGSGSANGVPDSIDEAKLGRAGPDINVLWLEPSKDTLVVLALTLPGLVLPCLEKLCLILPCLEMLCLGFPARGPPVLYMLLTTAVEKTSRSITSPCNLMPYANSSQYLLINLILAQAVNPKPMRVHKHISYLVISPHLITLLSLTRIHPT